MVKMGCSNHDLIEPVTELEGLLARLASYYFAIGYPSQQLSALFQRLAFLQILDVEGGSRPVSRFLPMQESFASSLDHRDL